MQRHDRPARCASAASTAAQPVSWLALPACRRGGTRQQRPRYCREAAEQGCTARPARQDPPGHGHDRAPLGCRTSKSITTSGTQATRSFRLSYCSRAMRLNPPSLRDAARSRPHAVRCRPSASRPRSGLVRAFPLTIRPPGWQCGSIVLGHACAGLSQNTFNNTPPLSYRHEPPG